MGVRTVIRDRKLIQSLNLLRTSPTFVFRERDNQMEVVQLVRVPNDGAVYWIGGESVLPTGRRIPSAFVVENGGGNLIAVYWWIEKEWWTPSDEDTRAILGLRREEVFPFDWRYAVPMDNDIYHRES